MAERLRYPLNYENDYAGRLTFSIVDENTMRERAIAAWRDALAASEQAAANLQSAAEIENVFGSGEAVSDIISREQAREWANTPIGIRGAATDPVTSGNSVSLYLPQALNIADAASYEQIQLGLLGAAAEAGIMTGGAAIGNAARGIGDTLRGIAGGYGAFPRDEAALMAQAVVPNAEIGAAISLTSGTTLNPNTRALFKSVPLRNFSFTFTMIPTSQAEAQMVENIVKFFRTEIYPTALQRGNINYGYRFPNRFLIRATYKDRQIPNIKFLPTYLTNFTANYNSNGMGMHSDGRFAETQITMSFTESKALARQDVEAGY